MAYAIIGIFSLFWIIAILCCIIFAIMRRWRFFMYCAIALVTSTVVVIVAAGFAPPSTPSAVTAQQRQAARPTVEPATPRPTATARPTATPSPELTAKPTPKPTATPQSNEDKTLLPGYVAVVTKDSRNLPCYRTKYDLDESAKALEAKDKVGFYEHAGGEHSIQFQGGEHVRFIDRDGFLDPDVKLRFESGENAGEACWVKDADKAAFDKVHEDQ